MTTYERNIVKVFEDLCKENGGASPHEVTQEMSKRGHLSSMDTVLDIESIMQELRDKGLL
jgi:hypothetical protein